MKATWLIFQMPLNVYRLVSPDNDDTNRGMIARLAARIIIHDCGDCGDWRREQDDNS